MVLTSRTIPWRKWMRILRIGDRLAAIALYLVLAACYFAAASYFAVMAGEPLTAAQTRYFLISSVCHSITVQFIWAYLRAGHRSWWHIVLTLLFAAGLAILISDALWQDLLIIKDVPLPQKLAVILYEFAQENLLIHGGWYTAMLISAQQRSMRQAKQDGLALEKSLAQSRLATLQNQTNPHFLFNALNTVNALIGEGRPDEASAAVIKLGSLLRHSLKSDISPLVTAQDDLKNARIYVALEHLRFGDRLALSWDVDPDCLDWLVPSFTLQPLLENIVKHAVSRTEDTIETEVEIKPGPQDDMRITVWNSMATANPLCQTQCTGLGLKNLRERLRLLSGNRATLLAGPDADNRFCVRISVPRKLLSE
jgi:sensor histidine kinase YesM